MSGVAKLFCCFLILSVRCKLVQFVGETDHELTDLPDVPITVDIYGWGGNGFTNGTGGGSGSFIRAVVYSDYLGIVITKDYSQVMGNLVELRAGASTSMFGGEVITQNVGETGTLIVAQNGIPGTHKVCVGARCNTSPCLAGCQGRAIAQQIIPGSGGLAPYHTSISGTIMDNPDCMDEAERYLDQYYTTNLLNCCNGSNSGLKCATDCASSMDGQHGNGGSGSINFDTGSCDGVEYKGNYCPPGNGGPGYVIINYENPEVVDNEETSDNDDNDIIYFLVLIPIIVAIAIGVGIGLVIVSRRKAKIDNTPPIEEMS